MWSATRVTGAVARGLRPVPGVQGQRLIPGREGRSARQQRRARREKPAYPHRASAAVTAGGEDFDGFGAAAGLAVDGSPTFTVLTPV